MAEKLPKREYRSNAAQLRALSSPVRIEIVGAFQSFGPMSIRELAEKMARPADGLYHHMRQLAKVDIIRVKLTRRVGKRDEAVFELTAERFGHTASAPITGHEKSHRADRGGRTATGQSRVQSGSTRTEGQGRRAISGLC